MNPSRGAHVDLLRVFLVRDKKLKRDGKADQVGGKIEQKVEKVIEKTKDVVG